MEFSHSISVRRLNDATPAIQAFYRRGLAARLDKLRTASTQELKAQDVRLTMGGEPTYVGIDDPESPQWNIDAAGRDEANARPGADQRAARGHGSRRASSLRARQVVSRRAVPRWALSCYWRADGVPVWEDVDLIAREER